MRKILCLLAVLFSFRAEAQIAAVVGHTYSAPGATIVARNVVNTPASNVMYVGTTYEYPATSTTNDQYGISGGDTSYVIYLPFGFSGTIFPFPGQAPMSPASYTVKGLTNFFTADFTASVASVSGTIRGTNGVPLAGVPINFSPVSGSDFSQISTPAGAYGFALTNGWSGTVTPVPLFGKSFVPPSVTVTSLGTNKVVNFNLGGDFVYGYVSNTFTSYGVDGVLIKFVGATNFSTTTTNGGLYGILLPYGWVGAITPSMSNGYFSPVAVSTTIMDIATLNFAYTVLTPLIAGRVTSMIAPQQGIANVPMVFSDGVIVYTDSNGYYFRNVNAGFTGTVVPTARPLIFFPAVTPYANVVKNMSNRNFTWVPDGYTYVDPMAFLTHRQTSSQNLYTLARADQGVVLSNRMLVATSTNIQEDLVLLDAGLSTAVSNVLFQRSYTAGLDPSTFWATNWTALWGGFIVNKNLWGEYDATYSNVNVTGNIQAPVIQTGTFSNLVAVNVYGWVDATPRSLLPQTNGSWVAAPPYTNVDAGFYTVDFALIGALTGGFPNPLTYVTNYVTNLVVTDYRDDYNYAPALQVGSLFIGPTAVAPG